jgi:hypothetical protein
MGCSQGVKGESKGVYEGSHVGILVDFGALAMRLPVSATRAVGMYPCLLINLYSFLIENFLNPTTLTVLVLNSQMISIQCFYTLRGSTMSKKILLLNFFPNLLAISSVQVYSTSFLI